jgi:two-component system cell cycle response regulator
VLVLLAHASAAARDRCGRALRGAGHELLEAAGAPEALALCRERRPDVLLAASELALLDQVKSDIDVFRTAVVLIEPREPSPDAVLDLLARGAQDFLIEPVRAGELVARVLAAGRTKILQEELVDQTARMEARVFEDALTGLYNRRFAFSQLEALVAGARRHERPLAVAMVDLDRFKAINDRHGHAVGDRVLVAAAGALRRALRAEDVLGRLGGEEFLAVLPDTDGEAAERAAERLRAAVAATDAPVAVRASVGWAVRGADEQADEVVRRADMALYAAKRAGGNRVGPPATLPRRT